MSDASPRAVPRHAVVIPHYNDLDRLARCLDALMVQDLADTEVIVADNASTVDLGPLRAAHPRVRFVTQPEKGAAAARNKGVEETRAAWIFFLDADCVPAPDWLDNARRIARGDPGTLTGGRIDVFDETPAPRSGAEAFETVFAFDQEGYVRDKGFSVTANLVTSRATFEGTGPLVVGLSEDVEWCRRAVSKGYRLAYDGALAVSHPTRQDWPALEKKWRRMTEEGFGLEGQGAAGRLRWTLKALMMPASVVLHLPRVLGHPRLSPAERRRAAGTLARLRFRRMGWMLRQAATGGL
ncbi:glycosyltransferase [Rhodobacterales bacterium HKCCE2091]|nr:glycosyltransferase [Rhodobacterales bacterium HKCCE2091]